jgi:hypothetical protein
MTLHTLIFTLNHDKQSNKRIQIFQLEANMKVSRLKSCLHGFHSTGHKPITCNYKIPLCMMNGFEYGGEGGGGGGGGDDDYDDDDDDG